MCLDRVDLVHGYILIALVSSQDLLCCAQDGNANARSQKSLHGDGRHGHDEGERFTDET